MDRQHLTAVVEDKRRVRAIGLSEHLEFFDRDDNRKISFHESAWGLERLGFGHLLTVPASLLINFGVSGLALLEGRFINPANLALPVSGYVRHPDSAFVDEEGYFDEDALIATLREYGQKLKGDGLTAKELARMLRARFFKTHKGIRAMILMPVGVAAMIVEWGALFWVARTFRDGAWVIERRTLQRFYTDPTLFYDIAAHLAEVRWERAQTTRGKLRNSLQKWLM